MDNVLNIKNLNTHFFTREGVVRAVNGVSFQVGKGQMISVVGESGCGKSVTALSILRIVPYPGRIVSGEILFEEKDLLRLPLHQMRKIRGDRISMIFQEPMISLNPAFTIEYQLTEALRTHRNMTKSEARDMAIQMLRMVEIPAVEKRMKEYPHQLSGGMRQRVMIAEALLLNPKILIADEPTTALDVTIQAQVIDIMYRLTKEMETAVILITHNLGLVAEWTQHVIVMYASKIVEEGPVEMIFEGAKHPYTEGLLRSIPVPGKVHGKKRQQLYEIKGMVPSPFTMPPGCAFHPRCPVGMDVCTQKEPPWCAVSQGHRVACWRFT
jgi:oligopeptide/dipeptide ABC transporter ATP-binding protein